MVAQNQKSKGKTPDVPWLTDIHITDVDNSGGDYQLEQILKYKDYQGKEWAVPVGFISDLSSIPALIRPFVPKTILGKAPWLHDYLYQTQPDSVTRKTADKLYLHGARDKGMSNITAYVLYSGLRIGGWVAWAKYKRKKV